MIYFLSLKASICTIDIRLATNADLDNLVEINHRWQRHMLDNKLENGFLSSAIDRNLFSKLVHKKEIVVADTGINLAGYYLVNNYSTDGILKIHKNLVEQLKQTNKIPKQATVGVGVQVLVDTKYQGSGLRQLMRKELINHIGGRYQFLFSTISKENFKSIKAHEKDGWSFLLDTDIVHTILLQI